MSSADHYPEWGTPQPPPMESPYGMPLAGVSEESGGPGGPGGPNPRTPDRRRKTLLASALAAVAVLGIGGAAVAFAGGGDSPKHPSTALAATESSAGSGDGSPDGGAFPGADASSSGKPNGDILPGGGVVSSAAIPGGPGLTSTPGSSPGAKATTGTAKPGNPALSSAPAKPTSSAPANPATSKPGTTAPKPSTSAPAGSAPKTTTAPPPSTDCTYLNLPPQQMPEIKQGSTNANAVKQLQCLLKKSMLGIKPLAIDGVWGSDTQSALTGFQSCNNAPTVKSPGGTPPYPKLTVDGVAGPQTWADLYFWDNQYFNGVAYYCNGTR